MDLKILKLAAIATCPVFAVLTTTAQLAAQQPPRAAFTGADWIRMRLNVRGPDGKITLDAVQQQFRQFYRQQDTDGDGVRPADRVARAQIRAAQVRSVKLQAMLVYDLDGDGVVTASEVAIVVGPQASRGLSNGDIVLAPTAEQRKEIVRRLVERAMKGDADRDGSLTYPEMLKDAATSVAGRRDASGESYQDLPFDLDTDGDGAISPTEFDAAVAAVFREVDADGDGVLSRAEVEAGQAEAQRAQVRFTQAVAEDRRRQGLLEAAALCGLPKAEGDAQVLVFGTYEGAALSNVAIGPSDRRVSVANVVVEPGSQPLYVILASYDAMIWQFTGAVDRIQRVVVASSGPGGNRATRAGVTGIAKERVAFPKAPGCLTYFKEKDETARLALQQAEAISGRPRVDIRQGSTYSSWSVSIPAMSNSKAEPYPNVAPPPSSDAATDIWDKMRAFNPGGLLAIDAAKVVASDAARPFRTLPQEAGLAQLVEQGALRVQGGNFVITRKITFPQDLHGAHSVGFILEKGVPLPDGDPGHSCVVTRDPEIVFRNKSIC